MHLVDEADHADPPAAARRVQRLQPRQVAPVVGHDGHVAAPAQLRQQVQHLVDRLVDHRAPPLAAVLVLDPLRLQDHGAEAQLRVQEAREARDFLVVLQIGRDPDRRPRPPLQRVPLQHRPLRPRLLAQVLHPAQHLRQMPIDVLAVDQHDRLAAADPGRRRRPAGLPVRGRRGLFGCCFRLGGRFLRGGLLRLLRAAQLLGLRPLARLLQSGPHRRRRFAARRPRRPVARWRPALVRGRAVVDALRHRADVPHDVEVLQLRILDRAPALEMYDGDVPRRPRLVVQQVPQRRRDPPEIAVPARVDEIAVDPAQLLQQARDVLLHHLEAVVVGREPQLVAEPAQRPVEARRRVVLALEVDRVHGPLAERLPAREMQQPRVIQPLVPLRRPPRRLLRSPEQIIPVHHQVQIPRIGHHRTPSATGQPRRPQQLASPQAYAPPPAARLRMRAVRAPSPHPTRNPHPR